MSHKGANSGSEGARAKQLLKAREEEKVAMQATKDLAEKERSTRTANISSKFSGQVESAKMGGIQGAYGLVTLKELKAHNKEVEAANEERLKAKAKNPFQQEKDRKLKQKKPKKKKAVLSFDLDADDDVEPDEAEQLGDAKRARLMKNPEVDTSFLPDRDRDLKEWEEREQLREEWQASQKKIKDEEIEITYSYWDGSGHRRTIKMKKGNSIEAFLQGCLLDLRKEFHELRGITAEGLIYIKEDLIIPSHHTFYDFIATKARGKSGPLFSFDVHDDVRMMGDFNAETDESHAGKVILRSWYDRNKHIFPANRWETYDPEKNYGDRYTIADNAAVMGK